MAIIMRVSSMLGVVSPPDFLLPAVILPMLRLFLLAATSCIAKNPQFYVLFCFFSLALW